MNLPGCMRNARLMPLLTLFLGGAGAAQDLAAPPPRPSGPGIYGVTNVDFPANRVGDAVGILRRYKAAARKQAGNQEVHLLQQIGWPSRFVVYEAWKDAAAYDANQSAAHTADFCGKVRSISTATCDRREYYQVSVAPSRKTTAAHPIYMMLHLDVSPRNHHAFFADATRVAEAARKERGNLRYDVSSGVNTPWNYMTFLGAWETRKEFNDYEMSAYGRQFREIVAKALGSPYDDRLYTEVN